jgi:TFIIH basal transcription factor complex TTD-A subunit
MPKAVRGTLVKCDASIKAMVMAIDAEQNHEIIIEDLDEEHVMVKETKVNELKQRLNDKIKIHLREADSSESEGN